MKIFIFIFGDDRSVLYHGLKYTKMPKATTTTLLFITEIVFGDSCSEMTDLYYTMDFNIPKCPKQPQNHDSLLRLLEP